VEQRDRYIIPFSHFLIFFNAKIGIEHKTVPKSERYFFTRDQGWNRNVYFGATSINPIPRVKYDVKITLLEEGSS